MKDVTNIVLPPSTTNGDNGVQKKQIEANSSKTEIQFTDQLQIKNIMCTTAGNGFQALGSDQPRLRLAWSYLPAARKNTIFPLRH
ncbi:hypothetical protein ABEB36_012769 [Hypothenemus hampei]|uniref:Uncharacterized protein n=1 Tax=Hypothenemus hampei TaxID=57062 RepID=A0ABD1EGN1_HYPHA